METVERIKFRKNPPSLSLEGELTQTILYTLDGVSHRYEAEGDDVPDLERDWAYTYIQLLET